MNGSGVAAGVVRRGADECSTPGPGPLLLEPTAVSSIACAPPGCRGPVRHVAMQFLPIAATSQAFGQRWAEECRLPRCGPRSPRSRQRSRGRTRRTWRAVRVLAACAAAVRDAISESEARSALSARVVRSGRLRGVPTRRSNYVSPLCSRASWNHDPLGSYAWSATVRPPPVEILVVSAARRAAWDVLEAAARGPRLGLDDAQDDRLAGGGVTTHLGRVAAIDERDGVSTLSSRPGRGVDRDYSSSCRPSGVSWPAFRAASRAPSVTVELDDAGRVQRVLVRADSASPLRRVPRGAMRPTSGRVRRSSILGLWRGPGALPLGRSTDRLPELV